VILGERGKRKEERGMWEVEGGYSVAGYLLFYFFTFLPFYL
jgi:hypothetical protein